MEKVWIKMFGKDLKKQKRGGKSEKDVDIGVMAWYYIQALEKRGLARGTGGAGILKTIQNRERNDS